MAKPRPDIGGGRARKRRRRGPVSVAPEVQRSAPPPPSKPKPTGVFAAPIGRADAPITKAKQKADRGVQRAEAALPAEHRVPTFPKLKRYTAEQRKTIVVDTTKALKRIADEDRIPHYKVATVVKERAKAQGDKATLQTLKQFESAFAKTRADVVRSTTGKHGKAFELLPLADYLAAHQPSASPGPKAPSSSPKLLKAGLTFSNLPFALYTAARAGFETDRAIVEDPGGVAKASLRTGVESIAGIPQAAKMVAQNPKGALSAIAKDYERRYGPILEGDWETFRKRLKTDYGLTPYALDAAAAAGGLGTVAGAAAKTSAAGRLAAKLAESPEPLTRTAGRALRATHETMTAERPRLRVSGGATGTLEQRTSGNVLVALGQHALDKARLHKSERIRGDAEAERLRLQAAGHGTQQVPAGAGRVSGLEAERQAGEVLPHYSLRETKLFHRYTGRAERLHGRRKAEERLRLLQVGGAVEKQARGLVNQLDKHERESLIYALQFGMRSTKRGQAVKLLERYREIVKDHRAGEGEVLPFEPDELPAIERIIADPGAHLTPKLDQVANQLRELEHQQAALDPGLVSEQAGTRRLLPQSIVLGDAARRAPDVAEFHGRLLTLEHKLRSAAMEHGGEALDPGDLIAQFGGLGHLEPPERLAVVRDLEKHYRGELAKAKAGLETAKRGEARVAGARTERAARGRPIRTAAVRDAERRLTRAQANVDKLEKAAARIKARKPPRSKGAAAARRRELETNATERRILAEHHQQAATKAGSAEARREHLQAFEHYDRQAKKYEAQLEKVKAGEPVPLVDRATGREATPALEQARAELRSARSNLEAEARRAPRISEKFEAKHERARRAVISARAARDDARMKHAVAAHLKGELKVRPGRYESYEKFAERVDRAATEAGLEAPGYFESAGGSELRRSLKAIGTGIRGAAPPKPYSGARLLAGRQASDPEIVVAGLLRNAKRRFSWRFTVTTVNQSAFEWSRGPHGGGLTAAALEHELRRRRIDPDSVEFVNVRILERRELEAEGLPDAGVPEPVPGLEPAMLETVHSALDEARVPGRKLLQEAADITNGEVRGQAINRYVAMPKRDYEELAAATRPDGAAGRAIDIVWKQKPARVLLGLANTGWLSFQVMANGFVAGLGGTLNPFDYLAAQRWWRTLTPDEKLAIEPELGITHQHHHIGDETYLGAAVNSRLVNAYHAFRKATLDRKVRIAGTKRAVSAHELNPLDLMFRADEAQNNFFRRAVLYNKVKRDAYARMGANWRSIDGLQGKLASVLSIKRPDDAMKAILAHRDDFTRHAEHVRDFLGDYLTYSSRERQVIARSVMFYGYLRFSLRFTFWTMPVKHPVTAAIISDLGRMGSQEVKQLLGVPPGEDGSYRADAVPVQMLAQMYFGSAAEIKAEQPGAGVINFGRLNPFLNTVTQVERPEQLLGLFSPLFLAEVDQVEQRSSFAGRTWRIGGRPTPGEATRPRDYFGSFLGQLHPSIPGLTDGSPRGRILERQLLELATPFRMYEDLAMNGSQSDDALPWFQLPMQYKDPSARKGTATARENDAQTPAGTKLLRRALPVAGLLTGDKQPTAAAIVLEREREKQAAVDRRNSGQRKRRKRKPSGEGFGGAGSGGAFGQ
jgi:hypothetical protein